MSRRESILIDCIVRAILYPVDDVLSFFACILAFFTIFRVRLDCYQPQLWQKLRREVWAMDEDDYLDSFASERGTKALDPLSGLGFSGSVFFKTPNSRFFVKSLHRKSEATFFKDGLLRPYVEHMRKNPHSLLVRITDFLRAPYASIGGMLRIVPSHYIVMENILRSSSGGRDSEGKDWETYDLKPADYFYPERDVLGGALASAATRDQVVTYFDDKIRLTRGQAAALRTMLEADTELLAAMTVIDYSLFLARTPAPAPAPAPSPMTLSSTIKPLVDVDGAAAAAAEDVNEASEESETAPELWRSGMRSADGRWVYRAVVLDFMQSSVQPRAKIMTGLVESYNVVGQQGPMSITTTAREFRERFLGMVDALIEVQE